VSKIIQKPVISVNGVYKEFMLPHLRVSTLKRSLIGLSKTKKKTLHAKSSKQHVLSNISFEVNEGDFFGIVGRNGSGKSTLLKIIAGIYTPSEGVIKVEGKIVPFIELGIGFNGELTGRENVYLNGALLGYSRKHVEAKFKDILDFSELEEFIDQKLKNYSSGMQVRLAFSVATRLSTSNILLIDEVLAVGDADFQRKCFDYFRNLKKQKKTVILVTHDMNAVREYCNKAMLIDHSEVIAIGSPEKVATEYTKLFQQDTNEQKNDETESTRWGNHKVVYENVKLSQKSLRDDDKELIVSTTLICKEAVEGPVIGISIMNSSGERLFGTNNQILQLPVPDSLSQGQRFNVSWSVPNIFNDGKYDVCVSVGLTSGEICDSWDEAKSFRVYKKLGTSFYVDPPIGFSLQVKK
jgi:ABC-2 type transport system ATP-binding protein